MSPKTLPSNGAWQLGKATIDTPYYHNPTNPGYTLAIDTETTGSNFNHPYRDFEDALTFPYASLPFIVSWHDNLGQSGFYEWEVDPRTRHVKYQVSEVRRLKILFQTAENLVFHNFLFDSLALEAMGINLFELGISWDRIHDTLGSAHVLDSNEDHALKNLSIKYLKILDTDQDIIREQTIRAREEAKQRGIPRGPLVATDYFMPKAIWPQSTAASDYAVKDVLRTVLLFTLHHRELHKQDLVHNYAREMKVLQSTYNFRRRGLRVRPSILSSENSRLGENANEAEDQIKLLSNDPHFNVRSNKQLPHMLYNCLQLPIFRRTPSGNGSTDKETIEQFCIILNDINQVGFIRVAWGSFGFIPKRRLGAREKRLYAAISEFVHQVRNYNNAKTSHGYLSGYLKKMLKVADGYRLYSAFNPWGTSTTRYSSANPNLQNLEKVLRNIFGPPRGKVWYSIDYNQLELRVMARLSGDKTLKRILSEGLDQHQMTADILGVSRPQAKNINFAWQYGAADNKLSAMAGMDATSFRQGMVSLYPDVVRFMDTTVHTVKARYKKHGFGFVETLFGYRLVVPISAPYKGTNYIDQGTAGDIVKNSTIAIDEYIESHQLSDRLAIILNVHDELVLEADKDLPRTHLKNVKRIMESAGDPIDCPTPVSVSKIITHWAGKKEIRL